MALTVQMVRVRSRWKAMKIRWKARCWGAFQVESRGGPVEAEKIRWKPGSKVEAGRNWVEWMELRPVCRRSCHLTWNGGWPLKLSIKG